MAGREVTIPAEISKVYSTGQPGVVAIYTLCPEKLLGWCITPSETEAEYLSPRYLSLPTLGNMQGSNNSANTEEIMARHPDFILLMTTIDESTIATAEETQKKMGIAVVVADYALASLPDTYRFLGGILGASERAEVLAKYAQDALDTAKATADQVPESERLRFYYAQGSAGLQTAPQNSSHTEVIELAGGINVVTLPGGSDGRLSVNMEQVLVWDPQIIITSYSMGHLGVNQYGKEVDLFDGNPSWALTTAVKNGLVFATPCFPYNWLDMPPSANRIIGLYWMSALLYPDLYTVDIRAETVRFYDLFYGVTLSDEQLDALLEGALR